MTSSTMRTASTLITTFGFAVIATPSIAFAQPNDPFAGDPGAPAVEASAPGPAGPTTPGMGQVDPTTADDANPAAVDACAQFAQVLEGTALYYGEFASSLEDYERPDYSDPAISGSNTLGRTALRQGAGVALSAANTPGLTPDIANPMRSWSVDATKLLVRMGLHGSGESLNITAAELNTDATNVQAACAAAGTHA